MKSVLLTTAAAVVVAAAVAASAISAPAPAPSIAAVPERAANFQLTDTNRLAHELHYFKSAPAIVLMSQVNGGKVSRETAAQLAKLQTAYKDQGVLFYAINSKDTRDAAAGVAWFGLLFFAGITSSLAMGTGSRLALGLGLVGGPPGTQTGAADGTFARVGTPPGIEGGALFGGLGQLAVQVAILKQFAGG